MKVKAVIFDLDGTLVDFMFRSKEAKQEVAQMLKPLGIDGVRDTDPTQRILEILKENADEGIYQDVKSKIYSIFERYEMEASQKCQVRDGVIETLNHLKESNITMGIVTNSSRKPALNTMKRHGIDGFFSEIITRDDVVDVKPSGEGIKKILSDLDILAEDSVYVGDSVLDIMAGRDAGVKVISIIGGAGRFPDIQSQNPETIIDNLKALIPILKL